MIWQNCSDKGKFLHLFLYFSVNVRNSWIIYNCNSYQSIKLSIFFCHYTRHSIIWNWEKCNYIVIFRFSIFDLHQLSAANKYKNLNADLFSYLTSYVEYVFRWFSHYIWRSYLSEVYLKKYIHKMSHFGKKKL